MKTILEVKWYSIVTFRVSHRHRRREMYIGHVRLCDVCVCLRVCPRPHAHPTARSQMQLWGMVGDAASCALLGGFAMGERVALLWQHSA